MTKVDKGEGRALKCSRCGGIEFGRHSGGRFGPLALKANKEGYKTQKKNVDVFYGLSFNVLHILVSYD